MDELRDDRGSAAGHAGQSIPRLCDLYFPAPIKITDLSVGIIKQKLLTKKSQWCNMHKSIIEPANGKTEKSSSFPVRLRVLPVVAHVQRHHDDHGPVQKVD